MLGRMEDRDGYPHDVRNSGLEKRFTVGGAEQIIVIRSNDIGSHTATRRQ